MPYFVVDTIDHQRKLEDGRLYVGLTRDNGPHHRPTNFIMGTFNPKENLLEVFVENQSHSEKLAQAVKDKYGKLPEVDVT